MKATARDKEETYNKYDKRRRTPFRSTRRSKIALLAAVIAATLLLLTYTNSTPRLSILKGLRLGSYHRHVGVPPNLIVRGRFKNYTAPPPHIRKHFFVSKESKSRGVFRRAFRSQGWQTATSIQKSHFIVDKTVNENRYQNLQPWQRYNCIPGYGLFSHKHQFISGWKRFKRKFPSQSLYFLPETYLLNFASEQQMFDKRLTQNGGMNRPWVLKRSPSANGKGIEMLGPHSNELSSLLTRVRNETSIRYVVQAYVCNELKWNQVEFHGRKFDLRFFWGVASVHPLIAMFHDGYPRVGRATYDETNFNNTRQHLTNLNGNVGDEGKKTAEDLYEVIQNHYRDNRKRLSKKIRIDPVQHVRNQLKEAISTTVAAFRNVSFGRDRNHRLTTDNAYGFYGCDFVIDNDLDVWYLESQMGPGMQEDYDARVEMHRDMWRNLINTVEEIQNKQLVDPTANLLPLEHLGGWEIIYADGWQYKYEGYERSSNKKGCNNVT